MRNINLFTLFTIVITLTSCNSSINRFTKDKQGATNYATSEVGKLSSVNKGIILSIEEVKISGSKGLGTAVGAGLGGLAGASTTDKDYNQGAAAVVGAVVGAMVGKAIEETSTEAKGYEFIIKTKKGIKAVVQDEIKGLRVGDKVYIINSNGTVRLTRE